MDKIKEYKCTDCGEKFKDKPITMMKRVIHPKRCKPCEGANAVKIMNEMLGIV